MNDHNAEDLEPSTGDVEISELTDSGHPDDTEWTKNTESLTASIDAGVFIYEFGGPATDKDVADLSGRVQVLPSNPEQVNLDFEVSGKLRGYDFRFGSIEHLTPEQADGLAAALQAAAAQARQGGAEFDQ